MKVGDLIRDKYPNHHRGGFDGVGVVTHLCDVTNHRGDRIVEVLWSDKSLNTVWDNEMEVVNESR